MILHDTEKLSFGNTSICAGLDPHLPCKTRKVCIDVVYLIFPFESHLKECCLCLLQLCQRLLTGTINTRGKPQLDGASLPSLLLSWGERWNSNRVKGVPLRQNNPSKTPPHKATSPWITVDREELLVRYICDNCWASFEMVMSSRKSTGSCTNRWCTVVTNRHGYELAMAAHWARQFSQHFHADRVTVIIAARHMWTVDVLKSDTTEIMRDWIHC